MVSLALLFNPSTAPVDICPRAVHQFNNKARWVRSERATFFIGSMRDRSPDEGLPRCPENLSHVLSPIPRWTTTGACVGVFPVIQRPAPIFGRVGVHNFTFEVCSGFTRVTARAIANLPKEGLCPCRFGLHRAGSYRVVPTPTQVDLSSTGPPRPRGAPNTAGMLYRLAWPGRRIATLGATRDFHHGLLERGHPAELRHGVSVASAQSLRLVEGARTIPAGDTRSARREIRRR